MKKDIKNWYKSWGTFDYDRAHPKESTGWYEISLLEILGATICLPFHLLLKLINKLNIKIKL